MPRKMAKIARQRKQQQQQLEQEKRANQKVDKNLSGQLALLLHSEARHTAAHAPRRSWELNTKSEPESEPKPELLAVVGVGIGF